MSNRAQAIAKEAMDAQNRLNKILEGGNSLTADEAREANELNGQIRNLKSQFQILSEAEAASSELKGMMTQTKDGFNFGTQAKHDSEAVIDPATGQGKALKGFSKDQLAAIGTTSYTEGFFEYLARGIHGMSDTGRKALQEGSDAGGGFLVPEELQRRLVQKQPTPTRVAGAVSRFTTGRDHIAFPSVEWTSDDLYTNPIRLTKTGEVPASATTAAQTDPSFGLVRIQVYTHMVNGQITRDFLEDGLFDIQDWLVSKYGEASNLIRDYKIISGSGVGDVTGLVTNPGGTVGGRAQPASVDLGNPITADNLLKLAFRVPEQYDENCVYLMNKTNTARTFYGMKDSNGRFLFSGPSYGDTGVATARPKELAGYPIMWSGFMPDVVNASDSAISNAYPVLFGDLAGYYYVERAGLTVQVLDQTKATLNQIELVGRLRFGGQPVESWRLKIGKQA